MSALPAMDLRPMRESDRALVIASWVRSFAGRSPEARDYGGPDRQDFSHDYTPVILALLARSKVVIACLASDSDSILGWMAWEGDVLHYVLTKPRWRMLGVAKFMLGDFASMPVRFTHRTTRWLFEDAIVDPERTDGEHLIPVPRWWTGAVVKCPVPKTWTYRRWLIWPQEKAA